MSYITSIFERANIQQIRQFLQNGTELLEIDNAPYEQRLSNGMDEALAIIHEHTSGDWEKIENKLIQAIAACEDVYMEIGLQAGIKLALQILSFGV